MKVCFFSPYVPDHFGGGEKHLFDIASLVATKHDVVVGIPPAVLSKKAELKKKYEAFLGYSLQSIDFVPCPVYDGSWLQKLAWTKQFEYLFAVTDGSLFFSAAQKNNLHIQVPFRISKSGFIDRLKLRNWKLKNTNSQFTKRVIEKSWQTSVTQVVYPMVKVPQRVSQKREKIILGVGRFFTQLHAKRQDVLIEMFQELSQRQPTLLHGWKLVLVGQVEDEDYFRTLQQQAKGSVIEFVPNALRDELHRLYKKATFFWHATGFGIDETTEPEKVEHFGITTLEAMAHGVVPIVIRKGGQVEIISEALNPLLWRSKEECLAITTELLKDPILTASYQQKVRNRVEFFDETAFAERVWGMF